MPRFTKLALAVAGLSALSFATASAQNYRPEQIGTAMMRMNAKPLDNIHKNNNFSLTSGGSVWHTLRSNFRMSEVNSELVRRHENKFMNSSAYFSRTMERSRPYIYHISNEVAKRNMPAEIALLPFIESAFVTKAKSHVGASGLWQFMPATGRHYGLEQTPMYDGRHDIYAATNAALNYLEYLHRLFGDWALALAAYNWGEGNVGRAINRAVAQGLEPTYENLKMPSETRNYVPKLLAVRNIVNNPNAYGIRFSDVENKPYFQTVRLNRPADISAITRLAQISESEFLALNPAFKTPVFMPKQGRQLLLPAANASMFERNLQKADQDSLLSWHVYTPYNRTSLEEIAAESGMSVAELKKLNGLRSNKIQAGHSILISKNFLSSAAGIDNSRNLASLDTDRNPNDNKLQTVPELKRPATVPTDFAASAVSGRFQTASAPAAIPDKGVNAAPAGVTPIAAHTARTVPTTTAAPSDIQTVSAANTAPPVSSLPVQTAVANRALAQAAVQPITAEETDELLALVKQNTPFGGHPAAAVPSENRQNGNAVPVELLSERNAASAEFLPNTQTESPRNAGTAGQAAPSTAQHKTAPAPAVRKPNTEPSAAKRGQEKTVAKPSEKSLKAEKAAKNTKPSETKSAGKNQNNAAAKPSKQADNRPSTAGHRVSAGDTLYSLAKRYNMTVEQLAQANNIRGSNLRVGQVLKVGSGKK